MNIFIDPDDIEDYAITHRDFIKSNRVMFAESDNKSLAGVFTANDDNTYTIALLENDVVYDNINDVPFKDLEWHIVDVLSEIKEYEMFLEEESPNLELIDEKFIEFLEAIGFNVDNIDSDILEEIINDLTSVLEKII